MSQPNTVTVKILDKDYQVACPEEQEVALVSSAKYLDKQMRSIRETGKVIGLERIAVMAALNISHDLLRARNGMEAPPADGQDGEETSADTRSLGSLNAKLDEALHQLRQIEFG